MMFLGLDLAKSAAGTLRDDSILRALPYLAIIAIVTATSYIQQKQVAGRNPGIDINPMQKNLMRIMPLSFAVFAFSFPAALGLYFVTSNTYQVAQQWYISRALYGVGKKGKGAVAAAMATADAAPVTVPPAPRLHRPRRREGQAKSPTKSPTKAGSSSNANNAKAKGASVPEAAADQWTGHRAEAGVERQGGRIVQADRVRPGRARRTGGRRPTTGCGHGEREPIGRRSWQSAAPYALQRTSRGGGDGRRPAEEAEDMTVEWVEVRARTIEEAKDQPSTTWASTRRRRSSRCSRSPRQVSSGG